MTIQANPPLPDPTTGRMPQYTQVLQQNSNGQWVVMYDVANVQPTSNIGPITPVDPGFTTPIEEFPDPVPEDPADPADPVPEDPVYTNPDIPPVFEGGGGDGRENMGPTGPGAVQFGGSWFDGETGQPLGSFTNSALNSLTGGIPGLGPVSVVGKVIGAMAKANMKNAFADMTDEARASMFGSEIGQKALSEMSVEQRSNLKKSLQTKMQNRNKGLNVGFDVHPDYSYDENQRNMRDVAGEVDLDKPTKSDSNFGKGEGAPPGTTGPGGTVGGGSQPQGPFGRTGGGSTETGSTETGSTGTGSRGPGGAGGRQKGGPSGGSSTSGGQGQSPGGPGKGRSSSRGPGYGGGR